MGRCTFCGACRDACPKGAIAFTGEHRLASFTREGLLVRPGVAAAEQEAAHNAPPAAREKFALFHRSLKLRQVSAGGCNACEADCNVLTTLVYDLGRFGIDFVASPRHADGLAVTGPVTENMRLALLDTYAALPEPRLVLAVGACAHFRRPVPPRAPVQQRGQQSPARGPVHSGLPAQSLDHPGWPALPAGIGHCNGKIALAAVWADARRAGASKVFGW